MPDKTVMKKDIIIKCTSILDEVESTWQTTGEYDFDGETHLVAYTDYTSNAITKNGLYIGKDSMLAHRVGAITCDMLFDLNADTIVKYNAFMVETLFIVHTSKYTVTVFSDAVEVQLCYELTDNTNAEPIMGSQKLTLCF